MNKFITIHCGSEPYYINVSHIVFINKSRDGKASLCLTRVYASHNFGLNADETFEEVLSLLSAE